MPSLHWQSCGHGTVGNWQFKSFTGLLVIMTERLTYGDIFPSKAVLTQRNALRLEPIHIKYAQMCRNMQIADVYVVIMLMHNCTYMYFPLYWRDRDPLSHNWAAGRRYCRNPGVLLPAGPLDRTRPSGWLGWSGWPDNRSEGLGIRRLDCSLPNWVTRTV